MPAPESVILPSEEWALNSKDERNLVGLMVGLTVDWEWVSENSYTPTGLYNPYGLDFNL